MRRLACSGRAAGPARAGAQARASIVPTRGKAPATAKSRPSRTGLNWAAAITTTKGTKPKRAGVRSSGRGRRRRPPRATGAATRSVKAKRLRSPRSQRPSSGAEKPTSTAVRNRASRACRPTSAAPLTPANSHHRAAFEKPSFRPQRLGRRPRRKAIPATTPVMHQAALQAGAPASPCVRATTARTADAPVQAAKRAGVAAETT